MFSVYLTTIVVLAVAAGFKYLAFEPVGEEKSRHVLFKDNLNDLPIYAHRGGGHDAPENTIAAIREAKKNGADGIEVDLSFTKDNIAILFHDETMERTTNGMGPLASKTFMEIRELDAASNHIYRDRYKGEKIATLEEGIEECLKLKMKLILDVKEYDSRAVAIVTEMFSKHQELYKQALVASFYPSFIYQLRRVDPNIVTAITFRPKFISCTDIPNGRPRFDSWWKHKLAQAGDVALEWAFHNVIWYFTGVSAVLVHKDYLSAEYVRMWRARNIQVIAWTPNHRLEKEYLRKVLNVTYISDTLL
ncbi:Glycerophosphodiester phosphodiesterase 1 like protein [Argiope bruennichi]|uniref:Glycerophosphodiester phosphodiesterase 1 like protein n=2 Tax=Argiope bruennichi TaxID=94029 RepID=A0A8T0ENS9_ARGBR|nr:Glycerophosphodiester phosphodiesterase 1 like protein [Argiope bruennichi]